MLLSLPGGIFSETVKMQPQNRRSKYGHNEETCCQEARREEASHKEGCGSGQESRAAKKAAKPAVKRTPNAAFMKAMTPSAMLAAVVGAMPLPRTEVVKKVWEYIKKNNLQDAINKRMINADEKLREIFGKAQVSMFEMTKIINQHLK